MHDKEYLVDSLVDIVSNFGGLVHEIRHLRQMEQNLLSMKKYKDGDTVVFAKSISNQKNWIVYNHTWDTNEEYMKKGKQATVYSSRFMEMRCGKNSYPRPVFEYSLTMLNGEIITAIEEDWLRPSPTKRKKKP